MKTDVRFLSKVVMSDDGCWDWTACTTGGYGQFWNGQRREYAHRFSYKRSIGEVPEDLQIDHICRNRACVNPEHLEAVTGRVNALRGIGWAGENKRKTHCKRGHELSGFNVIAINYHEYPRRKCRICWYKIVNKYRAKKRANENS